MDFVRHQDCINNGTISPANLDLYTINDKFQKLAIIISRFALFVRDNKKRSSFEAAPFLVVMGPC
jgi:hypothetical protein